MECLGHSCLNVNEVKVLCLCGCVCASVLACMCESQYMTHPSSHTLFLYLSVSLSVPLSVSVSVPLFLCDSVSLSVCLAVCLSFLLCLSLCLSFFVPLSLCLCLSVCLCGCVSVYGVKAVVGWFEASPCASAQRTVAFPLGLLASDMLYILDLPWVFPWPAIYLIVSKGMPWLNQVAGVEKDFYISYHTYPTSSRNQPATHRPLISGAFLSDSRWTSWGLLTSCAFAQYTCFMDSFEGCCPSRMAW